MYTRLMIAVLFVAAVAVNTATAQTNSTGTNNTVTANSTTAAPNATTAVGAAGANATTAVGAGANATTAVGAGANATTAVGAAGANATTAVGAGANATTAVGAGANATTAAGAAGANATTAAGAAGAGANSTTASNTTTLSATTAALNPVAPLTTSLSKGGCGTTQLCLSQPGSCDPSTSGSCYFLSAQLLSNQTYQLGLSGNSSGYIAMSLSSAGNNDTSFVCANNNGNVQFFTATLNGNTLQKTNLGVNSVKGSVNGNKIQCLFNASVPAPTTKAPLAVTAAVLTGSYNSSTGELGNATTQFRATADLSNPASHAITFKQSLTQALLIVAVALGLTM